MLTSEEKRALEIYGILLINKIRQNNENALKDIGAFFNAMQYRHNYSPDLLTVMYLTNVEELNTIPTHFEIAKLLTLNSSILHFTKTQLKKLYPKRLPSLNLRKLEFSSVYKNTKLIPKINSEQFHEDLLTFFKNFDIIISTNPLK